MTPKSPSITVVMPCFNEGTGITNSVESVFKQQFTDLELIVVDDGSSDNSMDVLTGLCNRYPSLRVYSQDNRGAGPARNRALKEARGEMIAFLDADDSWDPSCLSKLHAKLTALPDTSLVYCGWQNTGLPAARCKPFVPSEYETPDKVESLLRGCRWPIHAALTRRSAITEVGGFDEQWTSCMDYDLWLNLASFRKIARVPEVLAFYHHGGQQITRNRLRIALNHHRIQKKFIYKYPQITDQLGTKKIREIIYGELRQRAYTSYWERDLKTAHTLFRLTLFNHNAQLRDLKYMLPALLPFHVYQTVIGYYGK